MPVILGYTEGQIIVDPGAGGGGVPGGSGGGGSTGPGLPGPTPGYAEGDPQYAVIGSGDAQPRGLEVVLEYNGLRLGDRQVVDKYRVLEIDGLADADIRDHRENNPSAHGETPFNAYYGGRTLTITGRIEAYSIAKLRDMQQALRQAFAELEEKPLIFRTPEGTQDIMIYCRKSAPIAMKEAQTSFFYQRDFLVTLRASNPRFLSRLSTSSATQTSYAEDFTNAQAVSNFFVYDGSGNLIS